MSVKSDLAGRKILITGGASGIGYAFVQAAVADGAECFATARDESESKHLHPILPPERIWVGDLTNADAQAQVVVSAIEAMGGLDGFVHSAGIFDHRGALETSLSDWQRVFDINLTAAFVIARDCARHMVETGSGSIVLLSSQIGLIGHPRAAAYTASKSAVNGLMKALALELAPCGIRVNAVGPGPIATPMTAVARGDAERSKRLLASIPLARFGQPDEIAAAIRFLLSDAASFITGQILCADGGVTAA